MATLFPLVLEEATVPKTMFSNKPVLRIRMVINTKLCPIFCLTKDVEIAEFHEMIDWTYKNKDEKTVLILDEKEVQYYQDKGLWEIISNEIGNWLFGLYEEEWILDFDIMKNIIKSIHKNNIHIDENIEKILSILDYAIINKKSVIFYL